jgi:hypothetical protein
MTDSNKSCEAEFVAACLLPQQHRLDLVGQLLLVADDRLPLLPSEWRG